MKLFILAILLFTSTQAKEVEICRIGELRPEYIWLGSIYCLDGYQYIYKEHTWTQMSKNHHHHGTVQVECRCEKPSQNRR